MRRILQKYKYLAHNIIVLFTDLNGIAKIGGKNIYDAIYSRIDS